MTGAPRFLIVRLGALGDVVHAVPVVAALRRHVPEARIEWAIDPRYVELAGLVRGLDRAIPVDPRAGASRLWAVARRLRATGYDVTIDLQGLIKSAVLARLAGAGRTIGLPAGHLREPAARWFYTETPDVAPAVHVVFKNLALLRALGIHDAAVEFPLDVPRTPAQDAARQAVGSDAYVVINPGAAWPNKRWPADRFGALAAALRERLGVRSLVVWGPGEAALAARVVDASHGAAAIAPETTTIDLLGIAKGGVMMIAGDTGPLHLAAAVGTPVVALFGPTLPQRNGPWLASDVVVSRTEQCVCHYERRCRRATPCIETIAVEDVIGAAVERLSR